MITNATTVIGLTMRVTRAEGYEEVRDSVSHDWATFLAATLSGVRWVMLPNIGDATVAYAQAHGVNALVLTGGNDIGEYPVKDATDLSLLTHALQIGWPLLGVCRGFQVMQHHLGGKLVGVDPSKHAARSHLIHFTPVEQLSLPAQTEVNSFHRWGIHSPAQGLKSFATAEDGSIEAAAIEGYRALGVMWHPERELAPTQHDTALVRYVFAD